MSDKSKSVIKLVCRIVSYLATLVLGAIGGSSDSISTLL